MITGYKDGDTKAWLVSPQYEIGDVLEYDCNNGLKKFDQVLGYVIEIQDENWQYGCYVMGNGDKVLEKAVCGKLTRSENGNQEE